MNEGRQSRYRHLLVAILSVLLLSVAVLTPAQTFSDPTNSFTAGMQNGELYSYLGNTGLRRNSDGFDDIAPSNPRVAWGLTLTDASGNSFKTIADQSQGGVNVANEVTTYTPNSASFSGDCLGGAHITKSFTFVAPNVVAIAVNIINMSGEALTGLYREDFDKDPGPFYEYSNVDARNGCIVASSYSGFESPIAGTPFGSDAGPSGGVFGPADLGGGFDVNLGTIAAGDDRKFIIYYGINNGTQTDATLRAQVSALGATFQISNYSGYTGANSIYGSTVGFQAQAVPEPASVIVVGFGALRLLRRRK